MDIPDERNTHLFLSSGVVTGSLIPAPATHCCHSAKICLFTYFFLLLRLAGLLRRGWKSGEFVDWPRADKYAKEESSTCTLVRGHCGVDRFSVQVQQ